MLTAIVLSGPTVWAASAEVKIEAEGDVNYDLTNAITIASNKVKLTSDDILVETEHLIYENNTGLAHASGGVKLTKDNAVNQLVADELIYNHLQGNVVASGKVELTSQKPESKITAAKMTYDLNTGRVIASGGVTLWNGNGIYRTESVQYNINEANANLATFTGEIKGLTRDYKITGNSLETKGEQGKIGKTTLTRCTQPNPEYVLTAKKITYDSQYVHLENVVLKVLGVPVFYYPYFTFRMDEQAAPYVELGVTNEDGFWLKTEFFTPGKFISDLRYIARFTALRDSDLGVGLKTSAGAVTNRINLLYRFDSPWKETAAAPSYLRVEDRFGYNTKLISLSIDGAEDFNDTTNKKELGFNLTRNYWQGWFGNWQVGIIGRNITEEIAGKDYGGTYGGYRVDYKPNRYMTFSSLWLKSFTPTVSKYDEGDQTYLDLMPDFKLGQNFLYNLSVPVYKEYSAGLYYTFNTSRSMWIHRGYVFSRATDCLYTALSFDDIANKWSFNWNIRF